MSSQPRKLSPLLHTSLLETEKFVQQVCSFNQLCEWIHTFLCILGFTRLAPAFQASLVTCWVHDCYHKSVFSTSLALARSPLPFHSEPPCSIPGPQTAAHLFSVYNLPFLSVMYEYSHAHVAAGVCFLPLCMVLQGSSPLLSMVVCPFVWLDGIQGVDRLCSVHRFASWPTSRLFPGFGFWEERLLQVSESGLWDAFRRAAPGAFCRRRREGPRSARVSHLVISITHHLLVLMTQPLPLPFPPSVLVITVSLGHPFKHEKFLITVKTHCSLSVRSVVSVTRPDLFFLLTCVGGFPCPEPAICHVMLKTGVFLYLRQKPLTHQDFKKRNKIYYPWSEGCIWR